MRIASVTPRSLRAVRAGSSRCGLRLRASVVSQKFARPCSASSCSCARRYASSAPRCSASTASASSHSRTAVSGSVAPDRAARCRDRVGAAGERDDLGRALLGRRAVELERRVLVEPTGVRLPDRAHAPVDAAVRLAERRARRAADLAHRGPHVVAVVHRGDGRVVHVLHRVADAFALGAHESRRRAPDRGGRAAASRARGRSRVARSRRTAGALRMRSPRIVTRLGKCPNSAENMLPTSATPSSGSHTTSESIVSPPGTLMQLDRAGRRTSNV